MAIRSSDGFNKYILIKEVVFGSKSFQRAIKKANEMKKKYNFPDSNFPYSKTRMWKEYQFLSLCTFIEFRLSEFLYDLYKKDKIQNKYISKLKIKKEIKSANIPKERIFTPKCLLVVCRFTFGKLIKIIKDHTKDFLLKAKLLNKLAEFKKSRNTFIHHRFSSVTNIDDVFKKGFFIGQKLLDFFDKFDSKNSKG